MANKVRLLAMKRCKTCIFWQPHLGTEMPPVMQKVHEVEQIPMRKRHACTLHLRAEEVNGEETEIPCHAMPGRDHLRRLGLDPDKTSRPGPRYGRRTAPKDGCEYHIAKGVPYIKPGPIVHEAIDQVIGREPIAAMSEKAEVQWE